MMKLEELRDLICARRWEILLEEKCDCPEHFVRHFDGGNYHRRVIISPVEHNPDEIAVTYSSTCVLDEVSVCPECGSRVKQHDTHEHRSVKELQEVVKFAIEWVGTGWVEVRIWDNGNETVTVYEVTSN